MLKAIVGISSALVLFSLIPASDGALWELVVDMNMEKASSHPGEAVVVTGKVADHAYDPIVGAEVLVRIGAEKATVLTDSEGEFTAAFENFEKVPGTYIVNAVATWHEMTGLTSTQFEIKGDAPQTFVLQARLSTDEARKYLGADAGDFERDPIGQRLFNYYHGLLEELVLEKKSHSSPTEEEIRMEKQRMISEQLLEEDVDEFQPGAGVFEGYRYDSYVDSLSPEIRDVVASQLNFTRNTFEEAQKAREGILASGGTYEEARQAYLDMISLPKHVLEQFYQQSQDTE